MQETLVHTVGTYNSSLLSNTVQICNLKIASDQSESSASREDKGARALSDSMRVLACTLQ